MKLPGLEVMLVIILTLPIVWFGGNVLFSMKKAEYENDTKFLALTLSTSINIIQSAPDGTTHNIFLPNHDCKIQITKLNDPQTQKVKVNLCPLGFGTFNSSSELLNTDAKIPVREEINDVNNCESSSGPIFCSGDKILTIKKDNNEINLTVN